MAETISDNLEKLELDNATDTMSASTRVFNLPELLEKILLELTLSFPRHRPRVFKSEVSVFNIPQPAYQLFTLQHINSTFQATIQRSKIMQQRMFLSSPKDHDSLIWCLNSIGLLSHAPTMLAQGQCFLKSVELSCIDWPVDSQASWRKMPIIKKSPIFSITFNQKPLCIGGYTAKEKAELGDVLDWLFTYVQETSDEMDIMKAVHFRSGRRRGRSF